MLHAGTLRSRRAAARLHGGNAAAHPLGQPLRLSRRQAADGRRRGRGPQGRYSGLRGHLRLHARGRESREARAAARRGQEDHPHHAEYALRRGAGADPLRGERPRERGRAVRLPRADGARRSARRAERAPDRRGERRLRLRPRLRLSVCILHYFLFPVKKEVPYGTSL